MLRSSARQVDGKSSTTRAHSGYDIRIKVEILNNHNNTRRAIFMVGENPLNRSGSPLFIG